MDSGEWKKQIVDLEAAIAAQTARVALLTHAKTEALGDHKKLLTLEAEEVAIPVLIEGLKKRLPLLANELESALKTEAIERVRELEKQGAAAATEVSASRAGIRLGMQSLLDSIREAHATWDAYARIAAELDYLRVRFGVSPQPIPAANRPSPEEQHRFKDEFNLLMRHFSSAHPWSGMLSDYQAQQRSAEGQRQAEMDRAREKAAASSLRVGDWDVVRPLIRRHEAQKKQPGR